MSVSTMSRNSLLIWATFGIAVALVNPAREMLTQDDSWAYARSVLYLLETGTYKLDNWSAANNPVQIYIAAGLSRFFGYSLILLNLSTIFYFCLLAFSFKQLLENSGIEPSNAALVTLGLMASPLLFVLTFTFMTDIQFLAWLFLAVSLYSKGMAGSRPYLLAGSVAAAAAVGTRQFGVAIVGGWLVALLLAGAGRRLDLSRSALAITLPCIAAILQIIIGLNEPNVTQLYRFAEQRAFLSHSTGELLLELVWRISIFVQYLAILLVPVVPIIVGLMFRAHLKKRLRPGMLIAALATAGAVLIGLCIDSRLTVRPAAVGSLPWQSLGLFWMWDTILGRGRLRQILDLAGIVAVAPCAWLAYDRLANVCARWPAKPQSLLIAGTAASLFVLQVGYIQFNDTYVVTYVPFALLMLASALAEYGLDRRWFAVGSLSCVCCILGLSAYLRDSHDKQELAWAAAEKRLQQGFTAEQVGGPRQWAEYHGAFDRWIAAGMPGIKPPAAPPELGEDRLHDPFYSWLETRKKGADP